MRLYNCAKVIRSKNAGPFTLTIDLFFESKEIFDRVLASPWFTAEQIARLYGVEGSSVRICPFERVLAVKVSMPRPGASSGAPGDRDVYGSQQHFPLAEIDV
ncbi:MAG: DUF4387 domain-containing protein [Planctomycetes bacterium]|nr:DUF4387 domain-containing protein [Planctomycetota bacterium]